MYIKSDVQEIQLYEYKNGYDHIVIYDIINSMYRGRWFLVYRSPNASTADFLNEFERLCEEYIVNNAPVYVVGDFNINMHSNNQRPFYKNKLNAIIMFFNLKLLVKKFTRVEQNSKTIIDLFITNNVTIEVTVENEQIADHKMLEIFKKKRMTDNKLTKKVYDKSRYTKQSLNDKLSPINEEICEMNFEEKARFLKEKLIESVNSLVSEKLIYVNYSKSWYTSELISLRNIRNEKCEIARLMNTSQAWVEYRESRNKYTNELNKAKNNEFKNNIKRFSNDSKRLWKELKLLWKIKDDQITSVD